MKKRVVRAAIHPGIGIARLGNSDDFFIGPQVPWRVNGKGLEYRDKKGALKRQAAEFRIYGYDSDGKVVGELTADNSEIEWFAEVANKKASWYQFDAPMDVGSPQPANRRNPQVQKDHRAKLNICPGQRRISGRNSSGKPNYHFDTGTCMGKKVDLGELRTDSQGRLLFLSGKGISGTFQGAHTIVEPSNADGWYDDICDGPLWAVITIGKTKVPVDPAWVVVTPPNYAPELVSIVTMYDQMVQTTMGYLNSQPGFDQAKNFLESHSKIPSFMEDVLPILLRFSDMQWVNSGFASIFGIGAPFDFTNPGLLEKLADPTSPHTPLRLQIFHQFRNPNDTAVNKTGWPQMYGDVDSFFDNASPLNYLSVTEHQYNNLSNWSQGNFKNDWKGARVIAGSDIDKQLLASQPSLLDKAALNFCLGGPFGPGFELPWILRSTNLYRSFGRIRRKPDVFEERDYGEQLTKEMTSASNGPLGEQAPGDITRWMPLPWQSEAANCDAGYTQAYDPYLPTYWPARVPNHVLTHADYEIFMDKTKPPEERLAAFTRRASWLRHITQGLILRINEMVTRFASQGIVVRKPGAKDLLGGDDVFVEDR